METNNTTVEVIAHRGTGQNTVQSDAAPENTIPAFEAAWATGADACETDIHLTSDGELIVIHDDTTNRTTNADWTVAEHTLEELRSLDAGRWKGPQWAGLKLPTLDEVIATIPDGKRLFIELKLGPSIVPKLVETFINCGKHPSQLSIISFDIDAIIEAKKQLPLHECYLLTVFENDYSNGYWKVSYDEGPVFRTVTKSADAAGLDALLKLVTDANLDGIDSSFPQPAGLQQRISAANLKSVAWTVNEPEVALEMVNRGIYHITTDVPVTIAKALKQAGIATGSKAAGLTSMIDQN